jgi:lipopolysaccharide transport system permease protein
MISAMVRNRELLWALSKREIAARFKGSYGGLSWYVIQNLLLLALYSFVFGSLFKSRWAQGSHIEGNYTIALFTGLILFNIFAECISRAPTLILSNANYVKKVVFPLEILPAIQLLTAVFNAFVAILVLVAMAIFLDAPMFWQGFWIPIIIVPLLVLIMGLSWFLAALGTYVRDVNQVVTLVISAAMFLSPLFYQISSLPKNARPYIKLNPLTIPMEEARGALMFGETPDFEVLAVYLGISIVIAALGFMFFQKARKGFPDVL